MRTLLLPLAFALALLPRLTLAVPAQPVTMTAFLDKPVYQIGQPIVLEMDLHNPEKQIVSIGGGAFEASSFVMTIENASGQIVPRTVLGQRVLTPPSAVYWNPVVAIGPQRTRRCRINLTALFGVSRTGSYTVHISRTFALSPSQDFTLTAAPLRFQIVKAAAPSSIPETPFVHDPQADENIP